MHLNGVRDKANERMRKGERKSWRKTNERNTHQNSQLKMNNRGEWARRREDKTKLKLTTPKY